VGLFPISFSPIVEQSAGAVGRNILRQFPELGLGFPLVAVNSKDTSHAVGRFLLWHAQLMIALDLIEIRSKLFLDDFDRRVLWRRIAVATTARPVPAILYIDGVESDENLISRFIQVDFS
jgi:hypothetical protein